MLEKILEYPCSDMADIHRDANRLGIMDLEENEKVVAKISFDNVKLKISVGHRFHTLQLLRVHSTER